MQESKTMTDVPTKDEPVDYITFTSKFNDILKMYCISAINEEIEVFTEREDYARNVDPDNIEYIVNELKERLD